MIKLIDQSGKLLNITSNPKRIVSLVPSISKSIFDLGGSNELIAVTRFCTRPKDLRKTKIVIGGTKNPDINKILMLEPDLIIANKEENRKEDIEELSKYAQVFCTNIKSISDAQLLIKDLGKILNKEAHALRTCKQIANKLKELEGIESSNKRILYLIWQKPYMTVGKDTFINDVIEACGFNNVFSSETRYPIVDQSKPMISKPDLVFLSSEPYPFREKHKVRIRRDFPNSTPILADGIAFSWYGTSFLSKIDYLIDLKKRSINR